MKRSLTEAQRSEITAKLLAKWEQERLGYLLKRVRESKPSKSGEESKPGSGGKAVRG